jgi:hypothetical protein
MTDQFYKFPDQATMLSALRPLGMTYTTEATEESEAVEMVSQGGHQYAAHEVGEINGIEGWHYNLRVVDPEFDVSSLAEFEVYPTNPRCIWA